MVNDSPNDSKHAPFYAPGDESVLLLLLSLIHKDFFNSVWGTILGLSKGAFSHSTEAKTDSLCNSQAYGFRNNGQRLSGATFSSPPLSGVASWRRRIAAKES